MATRLKWLVVACAATVALAAPAQAAAGNTPRSAGEAGRAGSIVSGGTIASHSAAVSVTEAIWSWCGLFDGDQKIVRTFERYRGDAGGGNRLRGGISNLRSGLTPKWGYRHMEAGHQAQWESDAWLVGINWRNQADFAIEIVLRDPDVVTYNPTNDTFCYNRLIYLERRTDRRVVGDRKPNVVVSARTSNIITAFPSNDFCRRVG